MFFTEWMHSFAKGRDQGDVTSHGVAKASGCTTHVFFHHICFHSWLKLMLYYYTTNYTQKKRSEIPNVWGCLGTWLCWLFHACFFYTCFVFSLTFFVTSFAHHSSLWNVVLAVLVSHHFYDVRMRSLIFGSHQILMSNVRM